LRRNNAEAKITQGFGEEGEKDRTRQDQAVKGLSQPSPFVEITEKEEEPFTDGNGTRNE
jgi:hypothetical protein